MLSQQRFINLITAVNNYTLKDTPSLIFQYRYDTKKNNDFSFSPSDYSYFKKLQTFPKFGMHADTVLLNLDFDSGGLSFFTCDLEGENSEDTTYFFRKHNVSVLGRPLTKETNQLIYFSNQADGAIQYNFSIVNSRNLTETLYDLRANKNIGSMEILNGRRPIDSSQRERIANMFSEEACHVFVRILLKSDKLHGINPCIDVPIIIKSSFPNNNSVKIEFITKDPEMTNAYF